VPLLPLPARNWTRDAVTLLERIEVNIQYIPLDSVCVCRAQNYSYSGWLMLQPIRSIRTVLNISVSKRDMILYLFTLSSVD
jgi:hypothetical protein